MSIFNVGSIQEIHIKTAKGVDDLLWELTVNNDNWENLPITPYSGSLIHTHKVENAGDVIVQSLNFRVPKVTPGLDALIRKYIGIPVSFVILTANGERMQMGRQTEPAYLSFESNIPAKPDGYNGYNLKAVCNNTSTINMI